MEIKKSNTIIWVEDEQDIAFEQLIRDKYNLLTARNFLEFNKLMESSEKIDYAILDANVPVHDGGEVTNKLFDCLQRCKDKGIKYSILSAKLNPENNPKTFEIFQSEVDNIYDKADKKALIRLLEDIRKFFSDHLKTKYPNLYESCKSGFFSKYKLWDIIGPFLEKYYSRGLSASQFESDLDKNLNFNELRKSFEDLLKYYKSRNFIPNAIYNVNGLIHFLSGNKVISCKADRITKQRSEKCIVFRSKKLYLRGNNKMVSNKELVFKLLNDFFNAKSHRNDPDLMISSKKTMFFMYLEFMDYAIKLVETTFITTKEGYEPWEKEEVESCRFCQNK